MITALGRYRAIELALLGYILVVVALLTLSPFRFVWPTAWQISWWGDRGDASVNFLLFLPVGYFFRLTLPRHCPRAIPLSLLFGSALSFAIESAQLFLPDRLCSLLDLIANGSGAVAGAIMCSAIRRRLDRVLPTVLTLEHPLLTLVYLLVPLMWLTGVGVEKNAARVWLLMPLGMMGTLTLTALWRHRFAAAVALPRPALALAIQVWFLLGAVTGLRLAPMIVAQCAGTVLLLTVVLLYMRGPIGHPGRRFEHKVLAMVWPCFAAYLLMLVLWPHDGPFEVFDMAFGYPEYGFNRAFAIRIAEQIGALTLLGYLLAESFGRSRLLPRALFARNVAICVVIAAAVEIGHGFLPGERASVARWLLGSTAAGFGVMLYAAQLDVVQMLRGTPSRAAIGGR